jgi:hypothetical protein
MALLPSLWHHAAWIAEDAPVLKRPTVATSMAWVVGIVLSAGFAVTSLVVLLMRVVGVR